MSFNSEGCDRDTHYKLYMLLAANTFTMPYDQVHSAHEHKSKPVAVLMKIDNFIVDKSACVTVGRRCTKVARVYQICNIMITLPHPNPLFFSKFLVVKCNKRSLLVNL